MIYIALTVSVLTNVWLAILFFLYAKKLLIIAKSSSLKDLWDYENKYKNPEDDGKYMEP